MERKKKENEIAQHSLSDTDTGVIDSFMAEEAEWCGSNITVLSRLQPNTSLLSHCWIGLKKLKRLKSVWSSICNIKKCLQREKSSFAGLNCGFNRL